MRKLAGTLLLVALCTSCATQMTPRTGRQMDQLENQRIVEEMRMKMNNQMRDLEMTAGQIEVDLSRLEEDQKNYTRNEINNLEERINTLEQTIKNLETARINDKEEIIEKLSVKISEIAQNNLRTPSYSSSPSRPSSAYQGIGYEHTVAIGETISAIATAYNVSSSVIIEANNINNPNTIRVGQKLFIPE